MGYKATIIILYDSEKSFLLQHRSKNAKLLPGYWAFFGGGIKEGETREEAVRREALEEINCKVKAPQLVHEQYFREGDTKGYLYVYVEAFNEDKKRLKLQEGQAWGWFKEFELANLKMCDRDRQIIKIISRYLKNKRVTI